MRAAALVLAALSLAACRGQKSAAPSPAPDEKEPPYGAAEMKVDARELAASRPSGGWVNQFLAATSSLASIAPRTIEHDGKQLVLDETYYYSTRYGSGLSYSRAFEILEEAGLKEVAGKKVFDFGYGGIGHLKLLAAIGVHATGVDVDPVLEKLYSLPGDQGPQGSGSITLITGYYPSDPKIVEKVGGGYSLIVSKNVLKRGYIHPERPADPKKLIHLGVTDEQFLAAIHQALEPGGWFLIYNITPPPNTPDKPFVPWADGRSPFSRESYEKSGFEVVAFDQNDDQKMRQMAKILDWPDADTEYFAMYTLLRKK